MKALTISQPFASLIASGEKWIENRTWGTQYGGSLAIHAGKGSRYLSKENLATYPTGVILALATLRGVVHRNDLRDMNPHSRSFGRSVAELLMHKHCEGPYCWIMDDVLELPEPIPLRGAQGLWDVPLDIVAKIERALA